jgi:nitrite reductase/ring-hydroxylating ferredoxin subunit
MMRAPPGSDCSACCGGGQGRRAFLREVAAIAAGVAGALQIAPARAAALPVGFASARAGRDEEVSFPIPPQDEVTVDKAREVILVRHEQAVYAFGLSCPHQKTPLRWSQADGRFQCPKHKSMFKADGAFMDGRATRNMDRYAIRRDGGNVIVDLGKLYREDENRDEWIAAVVRL